MRAAVEERAHHHAAEKDGAFLHARIAGKPRQETAMNSLNKRNVVHGHQIIVMLIADKAEASILVQPAAGGRGGLLPPRHVSIEPLLKGGLSEADALEYILKIVSLGLEGHEVGNG
jgi:hypothetical protein